MDRRRLTIALLAALLLSGAVTFFLHRRINGRGAATGSQSTQKYVAATRAVLPGEVLKANDLTLVDWPVKSSLEGSFTKVEELVGRAAVYPIAARQPILQAYLVLPGAGIGLTAKIPEGMRAMSLRSDEIVGVAGFLFPGSHVDVLVAVRGDAVTLPEAEIVVQDAEVITAGQKIEPEPGGKAETVGVVTLLLTPADAQKVVLASNQGSIHFVLRNGTDRGQVDPVPVSMAQLSGQRSRSTSTAPRERSAAKPAYVVETILGDKRAINEFEY